jgi:signal transduction histidine kinase
MAAEVITELQRTEPDRRASWHIEPSLVAQGDPHLLRVVLDNLLGNAWKFTGKTINAEIEFVSDKNVESKAGFIVRDNGAGFDMKYASKLFSPFQRMHLASDFPGTGVGLATVKRIIRRHGGQISATSTSGSGAIFSFVLPA